MRPRSSSMPVPYISTHYGPMCYGQLSCWPKSARMRSVVTNYPASLQPTEVLSTRGPYGAGVCAALGRNSFAVASLERVLHCIEVKRSIWQEFSGCRLVAERLGRT